MNSFITLTILIGAILPLANSLSCYTCSNCYSPFTTATNSINTCPSGQVCMKTVDNRGTNQVINRVCYSEAQCVPNVNAYFSTYCCGTDLCNSTNKYKFSSFLLITTLISFLLMNFF